jgi:hypothetical protein
VRPSVAAIAMLVASAITLASVTPARADDDKPEVQKMGFIMRGANLHVTASMPRLFDQPAYDALETGFVSTLVIRIWIYPWGSTKPLAFMLIQRQVVYGVWDEIYELKFDDPGGRRVFKEKRKPEALKRLTSLDDVPIARLAGLPFNKVLMLAIEVELNPVSRETLTQVRRWLSQGTGGGLDRGGAAFGSFVSVFVNPKIAEADRTLRIVSEPFYLPKP